MFTTQITAHRTTTLAVFYCTSNTQQTSESVRRNGHPNKHNLTTGAKTDRILLTSDLHVIR